MKSVSRKIKIIGYKVLTLSLITFSIPSSLLFSQSCSGTGPNSPGTVANDNSVGTISFSNVNNAKTSNDQYSTAGVLLGVITTTTTNYLKLSNFGFSLPSSAIICGIEVNVERNATSLLGLGEYVKDSRISLVKGGTIQSTNYAAASNWGSETTVTYGASNDLWGGSWTYSDINSSSFGVAISAAYKSLVAVAPVANIDYVSIKVYYNNSTLSNEMISFEAVRNSSNSKEIKIKWSIGDNDQFSEFTVQRSTDKHYWQNIKSIPSNLVSHSYDVSDLVPETGRYYYRLALIKRNSTDILFSSISFVDITQGNEISIYPNPVTEYLVVDNPLTVDQDYILYNFQGAKVVKGVLKKNHDKTKLSFQNVLPGCYLLCINDKRYKIIKQ